MTAAEQYEAESARTALIGALTVELDRLSTHLMGAVVDQDQNLDAVFEALGCVQDYLARIRIADWRNVEQVAVCVCIDSSVLALPSEGDLNHGVG